MLATPRLQAEFAFHELQTQQRAAFHAIHPDALVVDDDWYLGHETWIRPAMGMLGDVTGLSVLDYGCGHGMASIVLARRGARVTAFDLSPGYVQETQNRAHANGVADQIHAIPAAAERLPFPDASFDRIWGNAVLHHVQLPMALPEIARVLKPRGRAVFCEPWGGNPLLAFGRKWLPYPGKERSPDEQPLLPRDLAVIRRRFPNVVVRPCQLLSMVRRLTGRCRLADVLHRMDGRLLDLLPEFGHFCRYVMLSFTRIS